MHYRQGITLDTEQTRRWNRVHREANDRIEAQRVYRNFREEDQGRSRELVCVCQSAREAARVVRLLNAAPSRAQIEALRSIDITMDGDEDPPDAGEVGRYLLREDVLALFDA